MPAEAVKPGSVGGSPGVIRDQQQGLERYTESEPLPAFLSPILLKDSHVGQRRYGWQNRNYLLPVFDREGAGQGVAGYNSFTLGYTWGHCSGTCRASVAKGIRVLGAAQPFGLSLDFQIGVLLPCRDLGPTKAHPASKPG
ncbi:hypothetical protein P7K49_033995 [Saguinus oedipus]|uniref:Uncharacterized protein n=1 Tax=Saguinus oedipus TaxID=9490 RepID=A0ABQ9TUK5_SAGOE|nr:hypothetical protein P7K49_033995 [Saguinus oedipus]